MSEEIIVNTHNVAVHALYHRMKPLIEGDDGPVVLNVLMIILAMMGKQTDLEPEHFKAFVVTELDRLMLITGDTHGPAQ